MTQLPEEQIDDLEKRFLEYAQSFKIGVEEFDRNIELKIFHTYEVCRAIRDIGESLDLSEEKMNIAELIALFHDAGRFEQYKKYQTFNDSKSENHAMLAVKAIREEGFFEDIEENVAELVCSVIGYHNLMDLPENESDECLFFAKLIRDADKVDIYRVVTQYYLNMEKNPNKAIELDLTDSEEISEWLYDDILAGKKVDMKRLKTLNDFKILQIGWVFDLNFSRSLELVKQGGYIDMIFEKLPIRKETLKIREAVNRHILLNS